MNSIASPGQLRASFLRWALVLTPVILLLGRMSSLAGNADSAWFQSLIKPPTFPPPVTFGIVWTVLYLLMGLAAAMIAAAPGAAGRGLALAVFAIQLVINLTWSPVFFGMHKISQALYILFALDVIVVVTVVLFWRVRPRAGMLLVPYLAWILFATLLNWQFLEANRSADGMPTANQVHRIQLGS